MSSTAGPRLSRVLASLVVAGGLASACGEPQPVDDAAATADTAVVSATGERRSEPAPDARADGAATSGGTGTGLENFVVPDDAGSAAAVDTVAVEIRSEAEVPLALLARAGAEPVVLDTLEAGARLRVDLVGPRGTLEVVWETLDGSRSGAVRVPAVADSVAPVPVGAGGDR
jgi:septal ring-binding cell division protein DamX